ncbi:MAG: hypothetical protein LIO86_09735 [Lachnospiraceae bacterium]|nr:hypothetical protein [Lachnospiraceae bacterium]
MANTNLSVYDDSKVHLSSTFTPEQKAEYNKIIGSMSREYKKVEKSTLAIAFALAEVYDKKYFAIDGHKSIYDFAAETFCIARGTTCNYINIIKRFGKKDTEGNLLTGDASGLIPEVEKFTFSKLCILLTVPDEYLEFFTPSMTAREMQAKKKEVMECIEADSESGLIGSDEDSEEESEEGATGGNSSGESSEGDSEDAEGEQGKVRTYLSVVAFLDCDEMQKSLSDTEYLTHLCETLKSYIATMPDDRAVGIDIGISYPTC